MRVDLNADVGEWSIGAGDGSRDIELFRHITSANVACGFHAGDPMVMRRTVREAVRANVRVGAHPGFQDRDNFGRKEIDATPEQIFESVLCQIRALDAIAQSEGVRLSHVKPHGAMYNMSAQRRPLADAIVRAIADFDPDLLVIAPPVSELQKSATEQGLSVLAEGFADRSYEPDGSLTPRHVPGAVIHDAAIAAERAVRLARDRVVIARDGSRLSFEVNTICIHGDTEASLAIASAVREALDRAGVLVTAG